MLIIFLIIALFLAIAALQDFKKGEIENWVSVCLVVSVLVLKLILSRTLFFNSLISLVIFFILGWAFFYGKLFEAGDAKLFMALGVAIPLQNILDFLFNFVLVSIIFIITIALFKVLTKKRSFKESLKEIKLAPAFLISYLIYYLF